jgi:hypothetical protein
LNDVAMWNVATISNNLNARIDKKIPLKAGNRWFFSDVIEVIKNLSIDEKREIQQPFLSQGLQVIQNLQNTVQFVALTI